MASGVRIASVSGLRGVVGAGLDPVGAAEFAAAYASACDPGPIVVGHDGRASAPVFERAVVAAVAATGHDVWTTGPQATPTLGRLVRDRAAAGGIQISASHNPPEYNGMKCFQPEGMVLSPERGRAVLDRIERRAFAWAPWSGLGRIEPLADPHGAHRAAVLALVDVAAIRRRRFRVVLDSCHGAGGPLAATLLRDLGCELTTLGAVPDGLYEHPPEPTEANLGAVPAIVRVAGADVGFVQDPDADRLALIDETGRYIGEEYTLVLAALRRLDEAKGPLAANLSTSRMLDDVAAAAGCAVVRSPVGEFHVVRAMQAAGALIGGEGNGGVIDPRVGWVRDSFAGIALVLDLLSRREEPLSRIVDGLPRYAMLKTKFPARRAPAPEALRRLAEAFPEATADTRDGLRLDWPDRWAHVRGSNTEPIVRVIAEAPDEADARRLAETLGRLLAGSSE